MPRTRRDSASTSSVPNPATPADNFLRLQDRIGTMSGLIQRLVATQDQEEYLALRTELKDVAAPYSRMEDMPATLAELLSTSGKQLADQIQSGHHRPLLWYSLGLIALIEQLPPAIPLPAYTIVWLPKEARTVLRAVGLLPSGPWDIALSEPNPTEDIHRIEQARTHAAIKRLMEDSAAKEARLTFDDPTLTVTLDGKPIPVEDQKAYSLYKLIATLPAGEAITRAEIPSKLHGFAGEHAVKRTRKKLPKVLDRTIKWNNNGFFTKLPRQKTCPDMA